MPNWPRELCRDNLLHAYENILYICSSYHTYVKYILLCYIGHTMITIINLNNELMKRTKSCTKTETIEPPIKDFPDNKAIKDLIPLSGK
jgi:hypothetical protein